MQFGCAAFAAAGGAAFAPAGLIARRGVLFDRALLVRAAGAGSRAAIGGHVVEHAAVQRQFAAGDVLFHAAGQVVRLAYVLRLRLSDTAIEVLDNDRQEYSRLLQLSAPRTDNSYSPIISEIVRKYHKRARSSIGFRLLETHAKLACVLQELPDDSRDAAIHKLIAQEKEELNHTLDKLLHSKSRSDGQSVLIRLRTSVINELRKTLADEQEEITKKQLGTLIGSGEESYYPRKSKARGTALENSNFNLYVTALVEEFSRLDDMTRENFWLEALTDSVLAGVPRDLDTAAKMPACRPISFLPPDDATRIAFFPFAILPDETTHRYYLVGCEEPAGGQVRPESFRLSRIRSVEVESGQPGRAWKESDKAAFEKRIREKGVAFFSNETDAIQVRFTEKGKERYDRVRHMRPAGKADPDDKQIYSFHCTTFQAKNYFLRLGGDVEILSPASLRQEMQQFFQEGAAVYADPPPET